TAKRPYAPDNFGPPNTRRALTPRRVNTGETVCPRCGVAGRNRTSPNSTPGRNDTPGQVAESPPATGSPPIPLFRRYILAHRSSPSHAIGPPGGKPRPVVFEIATRIIGIRP